MGWPGWRGRKLTSFQPFGETYYVSRDDRLKRRLRSDFPLQALFPESGRRQRNHCREPTLRASKRCISNPILTLDVDVTIMGQVYGLAGTDTQRRDLMIALLWGTPVALTFGIILAVTTSVGSMLIAAAGAWYGGLVGRIIQLLTEISLILPAFAVSLMVFTLYSRSIVVILVVTVLLTVFGRMVKHRATFCRCAAHPIEAARALRRRRRAHRGSLACAAHRHRADSAVDHHGADVCVFGSDAGFSRPHRPVAADMGQAGRGGVVVRRAYRRGSFSHRAAGLAVHHRFRLRHGWYRAGACL